MSNRRSIADFPRNEAGLVDEFIGSAFDIVYAIYQNLDSILSVDADVLKAINAAVEAAKSEVAAKEAAEDAIAAANSIIGKVEQATEARDSALSSTVLTLSYLELVQAGVIQANAIKIDIEDLISQVTEGIVIDQLRLGAEDVIWTSGAGTPEGVMSASQGSMYTRTDGGTNTTLYVKESGGATPSTSGWVAK